MGRVAELKPEELTDKQRSIAAELGATRGGRPNVHGPWGLLLRNEQLCERAAAFGTMLRDGTSLPGRLSELAIIISARHWTAQFEWVAHAKKAILAGVSTEVVEAIRDRRRPRFERRDEETAYDFLTELYENKRVSDATYQALLGQIGAAGCIELTTIAGFYSTVAMLIVAFEVDLPAGVAPPLPA